MAQSQDKSKEEKKEHIKNKDTDEEEATKTDEDDEEGLNVSLAAMEEKLKPKVLKDFDEITKLFKKLHKHSQDFIKIDKNFFVQFVRRSLIKDFK